MKPARAKRTARARRPRRRSDPIKPWARRLRQNRPGLVEFVIDSLGDMYGRPTWQRVHDPMSELVLTILSQNSADVNAEKAFEALRRAYPSEPVSAAAVDAAADLTNRPGWGGAGLVQAAPPDWMAVETAPL